MPLPREGVVEVHDLSQTGVTAATRFAVPTGVPMRVAFSPDAERLAVATNTNDLLVFDTTNRQLMQRFRHTHSRLYAIDFGDGRVRGLFGGKDGSNVISHEWDLTRPAARTTGRFGVGSTYTANGRVNMSPSFDGPHFRPETGELLLAGELLPRDPFNPTTVEVWDPISLVPVRRLLDRPHWPRYDVRGLDGGRSSWVAGGKYVAVRFGAWPPLHHAPRPPLTFSPLAVPAPPAVPLVVARAAIPAVEVERATTALLDANTGELIRSWPRTPHDPVFSPCGRYVALRFADPLALSIQNLADGRTVPAVVSGGDGREYAEPLFSSDGRQLLVAVGEKGKVTLVAIESQTGAVIGSAVRAEGVSVKAVDGDRVLTAENSRLVVRDLTDPSLRVLHDVPLTPFADDGVPHMRDVIPTAGGYALVLAASHPWRVDDVRIILLVDRELRVVHRIRVESPRVVGTFVAGERLIVVSGERSASKAQRDVSVWDTVTGQHLIAVPCGDEFAPELRPGSPDESEWAAFGAHRLRFAQMRWFDEREPSAALRVETLDGTPVPDALARARLFPTPAP